MTEVDQLLARLRKLPPIALDAELEASVRQRARRSVRGARRTPFASLAVLGTVVVYLGWALHFASGLY